MPIDAILFGGRRATVVPLVTEALNWLHGTFLGSIMASEKTAAAAGKIGDIRRDPMAMLPFCGYHMGDYFAHWLKMGEKGGAKMPKIFYVNWFRKNGDGKFMWPGYAENSRVLKWIFERCDGTAKAEETPIGKVPAEGSIDVNGLKVASRRHEGVDRVDKEGWKAEIPLIKEHFATFGAKMPQGSQGGARCAREAAGSGGFQQGTCRAPADRLGKRHEQGKGVVAAGHELTAGPLRKFWKTAATPSTPASPACS